MKVWLGVIVSAALLWLAARDVDFGSAWMHIQDINGVYLVPYFMVIFAEVFLRAWKWRVLLAPMGTSSFRNLTSATLIGLMANNVLPGRAGEFVRAYVGARIERISFSTCFATVVIDRVLDGVVVSSIFLLAVITQPLPDQVKVAGYLAAGVYIITLAFLAALLVQEALALRLLSAAAGFFPGHLGGFILGLTRAFVRGLDALRSGRLFGGALFISVLIWLGYGLSVFILALAMDIHLTLPQALVVLLILTILLTLPSTPGFLGAMELGIKLGLQLYGVDESQGFAFALVYHVTQYVPITLGGFIALWLQRFSMREIANASAPEAAQPVITDTSRDVAPLTTA